MSNRNKTTSTQDTTNFNKQPGTQGYQQNQRADQARDQQPVGQRQSDQQFSPQQNPQAGQPGQQYTGNQRSDR